MPFVPGHDHDVFISYAHIDNDPLGTEPGWVTTFAAYLKNLLDKGLGVRDCVLWMDNRLPGNEPFPPAIEAALRRSATLLVIASPSYLKSDWCARERSTFLDAVRDKAAAGGRVFRLDLDRIEQSEFPPEFRELLGYPFWANDKSGNPRTLGFPMVDPQREPEYFSVLLKLRNELAEELKRLRSASSGSRPSAAPGPTVFLADVTDDLDEQREEIEAYVKQAGLKVLPGTWYPRDAVAVYEQRMQADLGQSAVFVQLLSGIPGKKPQDWPSRLPIVQHQQAVKVGKPILQWRSRDLDLEKVRGAHPGHFDLLSGPQVRACGIEEFKLAVVEEATRKPKAPTRRTNVMVFVNSDSADRALADEVCSCLRNAGVGYSMPLLGENTGPAEVREDLELNLATCDGLILVYGSTPVTWVRRQLAQGRKILSQREEPLDSLAVILGPPREKPDVGYQLPNMQVLDWRNERRCQIMTEFASVLRKTG